MKARNLDFNICALCKGDAPGPCGLGGKWYCEVCWPIAVERHEIVFRSAFDQEARDYAGSQGGAYLEKIGKTDLATLEPQEWVKFLDTLFRAKQSELRRLYAPTSPPL